MSSMPQSRAPCDCVLRQASNGGQAGARLRQATAAAQRTNTQDVHSLSHLVRTRLVDALSTPRVGTVAGLHRRGAGGERPSRLPGGRRRQRQRRRLAAQCPRVRRARRHPRRLSRRSERSPGTAQAHMVVCFATCQAGLADSAAARPLEPCAGCAETTGSAVRPSERRKGPGSAAGRRRS